MKICFVNPSTLKTMQQPPLSLGYIASYLRKYDKTKHKMIIVDEGVKGIKAENEIEKFNPDVVAFTTTTPMICRTIEIIRFVKQFDIPIIVGGNHVTPIPKQSIKELDIDVVVVGEGEITFLELVQLIKEGNFKHDFLKNIKGICYKNKKKIVLTEPRPFINDLDLIPFPARDLINMEYYINLDSLMGGKIWRLTHMITSRGCPYNCVFCTCPVVHKHQTRFHSPEYVIKEIKYLIEKYKIEAIKIMDDSFILNKKRTEMICNLIIENGFNKKIAFGALARSDQIKENDRDLLRLFKKANFVELGFGFESGSTRILKFLKNNTTTVEDNERAIRLVKEADIGVFGNFMMGSVGETYEDIMMTVNFIKKHGKMIDGKGLFLTQVYPGTKLWDICKRKGLLKNIKWEDYIVDEFSTKRIPKGFSDIFTDKELIKLHREVMNVTFEDYDLFVKIKKLIKNPKKIITVGMPFLKYKIKGWLK
jgi:magnesium-protoporphyrin IX monomethyl ester (oxidative) cyclase